MSGILDPTGININPLNLQPYSDNYKKYAKIWSKLPAYENVNDTIKKIHNNNVILVVSNTGSGKTVIMPKLALHVFEYSKKVAVILPKQILTESASEYAAITLDVVLGNEVGYKHRASKKYNKNTKILYTTDGTLVSMLKTDPLLLEFASVVIDEAHERRTQTDFLLYLLKQVCIARSDFKLIIMSATVDVSLFEVYFKTLKFASLNFSGQTNYPITHVYDTKSSGNKYMNAIVDKLNEILSTTTEGDILVFVPSRNDTINACKRINMNSSKSYCVELFSGIGHEQTLLATDKDLYKTQNKGNRKIVVATNVAESSLTVDGIKFVIDTGNEITSWFDPIKESKVNEKRLTSKAQIQQRCGRTGRTCEGVCYHMYNKDEYDRLVDYPVPSIRTSDITTECLVLLTWPNIQTIQQLKKILQDFIEPPKPIYINYAILQLTNLKLVVKDAITPLGVLIATLPVEPHQGVAICAGWKLNCVNEIIQIIVMMDYIKNNINELFNFNMNETDKTKIRKYEQAKQKLTQKNSDHYTLLKIFKTYIKLRKQPDNLNKWLHQNFLKQKSLNTIYLYYIKMKRDCVQKLKKYYNTPSTAVSYKLKTRFLAALLKGYCGRTSTKNDKGYKHGIVSNARISKESWIIKTDKKTIFYSEMITNAGGTFLSIVSTVQPKMKKLMSQIII